MQRVVRYHDKTLNYSNLTLKKYSTNRGNQNNTFLLNWNLTWNRISACAVLFVNFFLQSGGHKATLENKTSSYV